MASEEQRAEEAARKKRVRAAHHGSVTRLTAQLENVLESGNARQMKQLRQSLTDKLQVLSKLDDKLIELVRDERLEEEVEQADLIRERTTLALISLEDGLESLQSQNTLRKAASPTGSSEASEEDRRSPRVVTFEDHGHTSSGHGSVPPTDVIVPATTDGIIPPTAVPSHSEPPPLITISAFSTTGGIASTPPLVPLDSVGTLTDTLPTSHALAITTMPTLSTSLTFSGMPPLTSVSSGPHMPVSRFPEQLSRTPCHYLPYHTWPYPPPELRLRSSFPSSQSRSLMGT